MDKVKEFIDKHNKDLIVALGCLVCYHIGFKRGFRNGIRFEDALLGLVKRRK